MTIDVTALEMELLVAALFIAEVGAATDAGITDAVPMMRALRERIIDAHVRASLGLPPEGHQP